MASKKPNFVTGMIHQYDVVSEQTEVGLANIKHFFKFLEKLTECMPQDFNKAVKGMRPLEGDVMTQYAFVRTQAENLLLQYFNHERDLFNKMNEVVVKPLAKFHAANLRQKRSLDVDLAKYSKTLKDAKMALKKDEAECRAELEKYMKMHFVQLELRKSTKEQSQGDATSAYEKFLTGAELETFKKQQSTANADAAAKASPQYADYRKQKKKTFELFNKYELQLQQARSYQLKFHEFLTNYLSELESMERYRMKSIEVFIRKLVTLFEFQNKRLQETLEGLEAMCTTVANLDEQQLQHSLKVWEFLYGPAPPFEVLEYRLPCKSNEIMEDYRTNFDTCAPAKVKKPWVTPKGNPPAFVPDRSNKTVRIGDGGPMDVGKKPGLTERNAAHAFLAEHGQTNDLVEWPVAWDLSNFLKSWRAVAAFKNFLEGEFSSENLIFWIKVNRYRADLQAFNAEGEPYVLDKQLEKALGLYGEFVNAGAPRELNLPGPIKFEIKKGLDEAVSYKQKFDGLGPKAQQLKLEEEKAPDLTSLYDSAQECIFHLVEKDSFERFKKSKAFDALEQEAVSGSKDDDTPSHTSSAPPPPFSSANASGSTPTPPPPPANPNDDEDGEGCSLCGREVGTGEKFCGTCKLRQSRIQKEQEDEIMEDIPIDDLPPPVSSPAAHPNMSKSYAYNNLTLKTPVTAPPPSVFASSSSSNSKDDKSVYALKSDLESLRKEVESLRMQVVALTGAPVTPVAAKSPVAVGGPKPMEVIKGSTNEPKLSVVQQMKLAAEQREREAKTAQTTAPAGKPVLAKDEFLCTGCQTIMRPDDNWCTECGLPRAKAKGPPGPPR